MQHRLVLCLLLTLALAACDLFSSNDEEQPTDTLLPRVILLGNVNVVSDDDGNADFLGQVQNVGTGVAPNVRISISSFDVNGALIDVASANTVPQDIASQAVGVFKVDSDAAADEVNTFSVTIECDGCA